MRVLYFTERDTPHDRRFLTALAGTDHQVFALRQFASQPQTPEGITELAWPAGQPDWSNWAGWQAGVGQFAQTLAEVRPDVIHAGPVQGPALVAALAGFHPLVTMSWGSDLLRTASRSPWMRRATRCALDPRHDRRPAAPCHAPRRRCRGPDVRPRSGPAWSFPPRGRRW